MEANDASGADRSSARSATDWLAEGNTHYEAQDWSKAGAALERSLALDSRQAEAWFRLGNVREELGQGARAAAACFENAVALDPSHARAWNNLGSAQQRLGLGEQAVASYRNAMQADPGLAQACLNLGRLAATRGDHALAAECFLTGLANHPGDPTFEHLSAAAAGRSTARAPEGYVTNLFDGVARQFERHLVHDLEYQVPAALAELVKTDLDAARGGATRARVIDLGCGTGLVGMALAAAGAEIFGVDLSPRMLEIASQRGAYANLEQGELLEVLARTPAASMRAVLAADVFIYIGDLAAVFAAVARVLAPRGLFAFSVEGLEEGTYRLQPSGRYAHSPGYLRALATQSGLEERRLERTLIRREGRGHAEGWLALFGRSDGKAKTTGA
jgi:predicted TPR repeat methyltransferase